MTIHEVLTSLMWLVVIAYAVYAVIMLHTIVRHRRD